MIDTDAQRIHDAFDHDLDVYQAPPGLAERARAGGLRRVRRRRMHQAACAIAVASAAAVTVAMIAPWTGSAAGRGRGSAQPGIPGVHLPPASHDLPSAGAVGRAMLTSFDAARDDIVYFKQISLFNGAATSDIQDWTWPAQPAPGQPVHERQLEAGRASPAAQALAAVQDQGEAYVTQVRPNAETSVSVTEVCYRSAPAALGGATACGWEGGRTPAGSWSKATIRYEPFPNLTGPGSPLNPAVLARAIALGQQWRILGRTELNGRQAIELSAKPSNPVQPKPALLWIDAQSYLPLSMTFGTEGIVDDFAYLPPTSSNLKLLQVPIPPGYSQSSP